MRKKRAFGRNSHKIKEGAGHTRASLQWMGHLIRMGWSTATTHFTKKRFWWL